MIDDKRTTENVRDTYLIGAISEYEGARMKPNAQAILEEFDRWLAAHDAEVWEAGAMSQRAVNSDASWRDGYTKGREDAAEAVLQADFAATEPITIGEVHVLNRARPIAIAAARGDGERGE